MFQGVFKPRMINYVLMKIHYFNNVLHNQNIFTFIFSFLFYASCLKKLRIREMVIIYILENAVVVHEDHYNAQSSVLNE